MSWIFGWFLSLVKELNYFFCRNYMPAKKQAIAAQNTVQQQAQQQIHHQNQHATVVAQPQQNQMMHGN